MCQKVEFTTSSLITARHAFSTRLGGVSEGHLASLNLGHTRGDEPERVLENWRRFGAAAGIETQKFVYGAQVHGNHVRLVGPEDCRVSFDPDTWEPADGYVTNIPGVPLVVFTADCVPVLLQEPQAGVIGALHCGWRSTVADIQGAALEKMQALGARPERVRAAVGPAIGVCCFETGPEVPEAIDALLSGDSEGIYAPEEGRPGKYMVDLRLAVKRRFLQLGLRPEHIDISTECTMCHPERYWSHRYTRGVRGTQANIIVL